MDPVSILCGAFHGLFVWHVISKFLSVEDFGFPLECLVLDHSLNIVFPVLVFTFRETLVLFCNPSRLFVAHLKVCTPLWEKNDALLFLENEFLWYLML